MTISDSPSQLSVSLWIDRLRSAGRPALTWYSIDRVELGGPVMASWLTKTDNFLDAEFPFGGQSFAVEMPLSWRTLPWVGAGWLRGWELVSIGDRPDLLISDDLELLEDFAMDGSVAVAQALGPMALSWEGRLPSGIQDGVADVLGQADHLVTPVQSPTVGKIFGDHRLSELTTVSMLGNSELTGTRVRVTATDPARLSAQIMQLWWVGASAVFIDEGHYGPEKIVDICRQENVDWTLAD